MQPRLLDDSIRSMTFESECERSNKRHRRHSNTVQLSLPQLLCACVCDAYSNRKSFVCAGRKLAGAT